MLHRLFLAISLTVLVFAFSGCATDDPDNVSARPWNHPRGWESGLPPQMLEGR
jgi:hypothetical protein